MTDIYGHVSVRYDATKVFGDNLMKVTLMVPSVFHESFEYHGYIFYIHHDPKKDEWSVIERYTGLNACWTKEGRIWKTKKDAVDKAMSNLNRYLHDGTLHDRLKKSWRAWVETKSSSVVMNAIKMKKMRLL